MNLRYDYKKISRKGETRARSYRMGIAATESCAAAGAAAGAESWANVYLQTQGASGNCIINYSIVHSLLVTVYLLRSTHAHTNLLHIISR